MYEGTSYLWGLIIEVASCHPSGSFRWNMLYTVWVAATGEYPETAQKALKLSCNFQCPI